MADRRGSGDGLVITLTCCLIGMFLLNEVAGIVWPSFVYVAVRALGIPMVALVDTVASLVVVIRPMQSTRTRIIGCLGIVVSLNIWAFQWLWSGALFGLHVVIGGPSRAFVVGMTRTRG